MRVFVRMVLRDCVVTVFGVLFAWFIVLESRESRESRFGNRRDTGIERIEVWESRFGNRRDR